MPARQARPYSICRPGGRGRLIVLFPTNIFASSNVITRNTQGGDTILGTGPSGVTSVTAQKPIMAQSDGSGHWILVN